MPTLLYLSFIKAFFFSDNSLYDISFESLKGDVINMATYKGQRVLVFVTDGANPDIKHLAITDSVMKVDQTITKIIIIPAIDLGDSTKTLSPDKLTTLFSNLERKDIIVSKPVRVKKESKTEQNPLLQWLTDPQKNGHFDRNVEEDGVVFMINENGLLYGIHEKWLPAEGLQKAITQKIKQ
jgi:hypothetical protein